MIKKIIIVQIILIVFLTLGYFGFKQFEKQKKDEKPKLVFWSIQLKPIYENELKKIIEEFENENDCKVVWIDIPIQEAQKRTLASILSSTPPDLVNLNPDFSQILAQKNALEYFEDYEVEDYLESLVDKLKYEDKIYALPFYATSPVTIYNKEVFDKCNKAIPKTYQGLYNISSQLKICSEIPSFASNLAENDTFAKILNKYDVTSFQDEESILKAIEVYSMFNEMYKNDFMPQDVLSINHREVIEKYMSNQALVVVAGSNFINMIKQNAPDIYLKSAISNQLTGSNGKYDVALMNLIIPKKAKNKELAKDFAYILTNKEHQLELSKLTNVLPANKEALSDDYFKKCSSDLVDFSRCKSAMQLSGLNDKTFSAQNRKITNEAINKTLEEILLNNIPVDVGVYDLASKVH